MTANNNQRIIIYKKMWIKQLLFVDTTVSSLSNTSFSNPNTNLPIRCFSQKQF